MIYSIVEGLVIILIGALLIWFTNDNPIEERDIFATDRRTYIGGIVLIIGGLWWIVKALMGHLG